MNKAKCLFLLRSVIYALICFAGGCALTVWLFHNPLNAATLVYFAVTSCAIGAAVAVFSTEDMPPWL